jgi:hypothetical protein
MALLSFRQYVAAHPDQINELPANTMWAQGTGGFEFYPLQIDPATGKLDTNAASGSNGGITSGGININKTADNTTPILAAVGGANLASRVSLTVYNNATVISTEVVYWGYSSGVTAATGTPIPAQTGVSWSIGAGQDVYLISSAASTDVRISEAA